jgi:hypothetical protein
LLLIVAVLRLLLVDACLTTEAGLSRFGFLETFASPESRECWDTETRLGLLLGM